MKIWFKDQYRKIPIPSRALIRLVGMVLTEMGEEKAEVGLVLVGDAEVRNLNRHYRGIDRATDILAFAMEDPISPRPSRIKARPITRHLSPPRVDTYFHLLGDLVISMEAAKRQARQRRHSLEREMTILIIHGLLHLLGYDHERSLIKARAMMRKEKELLERISKRI